MAIITANEELTAMMKDLGATAEELQNHMYCDISLALIQSWMCGRRQINKSSAKTVFNVAKAINDIAYEKRGFDYATDNYPVGKVLLTLCKSPF